jgi:hypothetical protein
MGFATELLPNTIEPSQISNSIKIFAGNSNYNFAELVARSNKLIQTARSQTSQMHCEQIPQHGDGCHDWREC